MNDSEDPSTLDLHGAGYPTALERDPDDLLIAEALDQYWRSRKSNRPISIQELLLSYPTIAGALHDCLDGFELVESAAVEIANDDLSNLDLALGVPSRLGDFEITGEVGRGGMGVVFEAVQVSLGRRVALKVLASSAALDQRRLHRFQLESRCAAQLQHPHIIPVYAVGENAGVYYYAMQFIEGPSLAEVIHTWARNAHPQGDDRPTSGGLITEQGIKVEMPIKRDYGTIARLALEAAEALAHAHALGVVHRDVKPSNLLIDSAGSVWVGDFGLARIRDDDNGLTRSGELIGTLRYMSPEQALGSAGLDERSDVYSFGRFDLRAPDTKSAVSNSAPDRFVETDLDGRAFASAAFVAGRSNRPRDNRAQSYEQRSSKPLHLRQRLGRRPPKFH